MKFIRSCVMFDGAALVASAVACKKSKPEAAEQPAPAAEQPAAAAQASAPAPNQPAPAEQSVRIVETAPAQAQAPAPAATRVVVKAASSIRGADQVNAALQRKDYVGAVATLQAVKASVRIEDRPEYNDLMRQVKQVIIEAMAKEPAAKRAYDMMRLVEAGR